jgi:hypothetical protein
LTKLEGNQQEGGDREEREEIKNNPLKSLNFMNGLSLQCLEDIVTPKFNCGIILSSPFNKKPQSHFQLLLTNFEQTAIVALDFPRNVL